MIDFVKQSIHTIIELKKQRHFLPGVLLGGYAIVILASVMSIWSFILLGKIDNHRLYKDTKIKKYTFCLIHY